MRLCLTLDVERPLTLPIDHYPLLRGAVYRMLGQGNPELAASLHEDGYALPSKDGEVGTDTRRYKLFNFSLLRIPKTRRRFAGDRIHIAPGLVQWFISSPREDFLRAEIDGLLQSQNGVVVGDARLPLVSLEALPPPVLQETQRFSCLTPLVAAVPSPDRPTPYYLRPTDGERFSEAIRQNLLRKHQILHDALPADTVLTLTFDPAYLERDKHNGTKKATLGPIDVVGAFAPFTLSGSTALMQTAYDCGIGQLNASGFGMIALL